MNARTLQPALAPGVPPLLSRQHWDACARCLHLLILFISLGQVEAQSPSRESQLKAVLLWRLAQYVEWPPEVFHTQDAPVVIGVLGENPFGKALEVAVRGETAHQHPIQVRYIKTAEEALDCQIVFISQKDPDSVRRTTAALRGHSILTVSDADGFATREDGMVRFSTEQNKVRLVVNLEEVTGAHLKLDARLLRMAEIVKSN